MSGDDEGFSFRMFVKSGRYTTYSPVPTDDAHGDAGGLADPLALGGSGEDAEAAATAAAADGAESKPVQWRSTQSTRCGCLLRPVPDDATMYERWLAGEFTIVPDEHRGLDVWDIIVILALVATAIVLPFEVAFYKEPPLSLHILGQLVDIIFIADIIITFQVAYTVPNALTNELYERSPLKIAKHYLAFPCADGGTGGWFWPDLLTVLPWDGLGVKSIRFVRILRLLRMMRLVRVVKLCDRWHSRIGTSYAFLTICKCATLTLVAMHWLTCIWGFMAMSSRASEDEPSWLKLYAVRTHFDAHEFGLYDVYNLSMYFCVMTLTGVGFGDVSPSGQFEVQISTITMFVTGFMWAWVIANVVNVVNNLDAYFTHFQKLNDDLNKVLETRGLSQTLQMRARKHLHEAFKVHRQRHQQSTIRALSPGLQGEIALQSGADHVCNCVWYLRGVDPDVLVELVNYFVPDMYSPAEFILHKQAVSVIRRGSCWFKTRILVRDDIIGEDMLLDSEHLRDSIFPKTLNYVEVMTLQREDLQHVCQKFPSFSQKVRMAQIRLALLRGFIYYSRQVRVLKSMPGMKRREISTSALPTSDPAKAPPRFFTTNDRHTQLYNVVSDLKQAFEDRTQDIRKSQLKLAERISRLEPPPGAVDATSAEEGPPLASSGRPERRTGPASAPQEAALSVRLAELEAAQMRLAERLGTLAEQQAQAIELCSGRGQPPRDQAVVLGGAGNAAPVQPMLDLAAPSASLEAEVQSNPSGSHDVGEPDMMERSQWSTGPRGDIGGTLPFKSQQPDTGEPRWAEGVLARLDDLEKGLSRRHDALEASLARQLRQSEEIERKISEHLPSKWAEVSSGGSEAASAPHQLKQLSDSLIDSLAAMFASQQSLLEVSLTSPLHKCNSLQESILAQTESLQRKLTELSEHTSNELRAFSAGGVGEAYHPAQLHARADLDQGRLAKTIRQKGLSLETAVSAQLLDFGTALRQRIEAQLLTVREATSDLVRRQGESLKASLQAQLGGLEGDCLRRAERVYDGGRKRQDEGGSPASHSLSHACSTASPQGSEFAA